MDATTCQSAHLLCRAVFFHRAAAKCCCLALRTGRLITFRFPSGLRARSEHKPRKLELFAIIDGFTDALKKRFGDLANFPCRNFFRFGDRRRDVLMLISYLIEVIVKGLFVAIRDPLTSL